MSQLTIPNFVLIPAGYRSGVVYQQLPRLNYMSFTRATNQATKINKEGFIERVGSDYPRIGYELNVDGVPSDCPTLSLEDEATNLIPDSEDFDTGSWTHTNITVTPENGPSPDGKYTADKLQQTATGVRYAYDNTVLVINEDAYFSVFAKAGRTGWFAMGLYDFAGPTTDSAIGTFDLVNGVVGNTSLSSISLLGRVEISIEKYPNGWYRCILKLNATSSGSWSARVYTSAQSINNITGTSGDNIYVWGAQVEVNDYCSSYIWTSGGTFTRSKESCNQPGASNNDLPQQSGLLYAEMRCFWDDTVGSQCVAISDGSSANVVGLIFSQPTSNEITCNMQKGSATLQLFSTTVADVTQYQKVACSWRDNNFQFYVNGVEVGNVIIGTSYPPNTFSEMNFGWAGGSTYPFYGACKDLRAYDTTKLSVAEITDLLITLTQ